MNTIFLSDGSSIEFDQYSIDNEYIQGAERSVLELRFDPAKTTLDQVDQLFTDENCGHLCIKETQANQIPVFEEQEIQMPVLDDTGNDTGETITETQIVQTGVKDEAYTNEYLFDGYCVRTILSRQLLPTPTGNGLVDKDRIMIRLAQRTYTESQIVALAEENTNTQLALVEVYEMLLG